MASVETLVKRYGYGVFLIFFSVLVACSIHKMVCSRFGETLAEALSILPLNLDLTNIICGYCCFLSAQPLGEVSLHTLFTIGSFGRESPQAHGVVTQAVAAVDNTLFVGAGSRIFVFNSWTGHVLGHWPSAGLGARGMAVGDRGELFVSHAHLQSVTVYQIHTDSAGSVSGSVLRKFGVFGEEQGQFRTPAGIAVNNKTRTVCVVDRDLHRVSIFTCEGKFIRTFGSWGKSKGRFKSPSYCAINDKGHIAVSDTENGRVQLFDAKGVFLRVFSFTNLSLSNVGRTFALDIPTGLCFDRDQNLVVASDRVHVFTPEGKLICGHERMNMKPRAICSDFEGRLFVVPIPILTVSVRAFCSEADKPKYFHVDVNPTS